MDGAIPPPAIPGPRICLGALFNVYGRAFPDILVVAFVFVITVLLAGFHMTVLVIEFAMVIAFDLVIGYVWVFAGKRLEKYLTSCSRHTLGS